MQGRMFARALLLWIAILVAVPSGVRAQAIETYALDSQTEFDSAVERFGIDSTTVPGAIRLPDLNITQSPTPDTRDVALITSNPASPNSDIVFYLDSYFTNFVSNGTGSDDVYGAADVSSLAVISSYDVVVVDDFGITSLSGLPMTTLESYAQGGGTLVMNTASYAGYKQSQIYTENISYATSIANGRDMASDANYIYLMSDDASADYIQQVNPTTGVVNATFCAPSTGTRGIEIVGSTVYIADTTADRLYEIPLSGLTTYDGTCASPNQGTAYNFSDLGGITSPWGLASDGTNFYVIDSVSDILYRFTISGASLVLGTSSATSLAPLPIDVPRGLAWDGDSLWLADSNSNLIHDMDSSFTTVRSYDAYDGFSADNDVVGMAFFGGDIWAFDDEPGVKRLYNLSSYNRMKPNYTYNSYGNISFATPGPDPKGLAYDGTDFWLVDDFQNTLYRVSAATGAVLQSCITPAKTPNGVAYNAGTLYISDVGTDSIYLVNPTTCAVTGSYATPSTSPRGLVHDGTSLWHTDSTSNLIYRINPATGAVLQSFATATTTPRGLAYDGSELWVAHETADLYYEMNATTGAPILNRAVVELSAEGIAFRNNHMWSIDDVSNRLYDVDSANIADAQFILPDNAAGGFAYNGTDIYYASTEDDLIYRVDETTGAVLGSFASPAADPEDITWDGTYLWVVTNSNNMTYRITTAGAVQQSFATPSTDPQGIVYAFGNLYISDPGTNFIYSVNPTTGAIITPYEAPGSEAGPLAFDGTYVWNNDTIEEQVFAMDFSGDDEGEVAATKDVVSKSTVGIEFISGDLWFSEDYVDRFYNESSYTPLPEVTITSPDGALSPYVVGDYFYLGSTDSQDSTYTQRRITNIPASPNITELASSNRGGSGIVKETVGSGQIYAMDLFLVGKNYEVSRQTVPAVTIFLGMLGIHINSDGVHENTRPTYASISADLTTLQANPANGFTRVQYGTSSNGQPLYRYDFGAGAGKPILLYVAGAHGNEEHAYVALVRYMEELATRLQSNDPVAHTLHEHYQMSFIPLFNPYGIEFLSRYNANNVDLNRNYDYDWASDISPFKGSAPFSEPETAAFRDFVVANQSRIEYINDSHSAVSIPVGFTWAETNGIPTPQIMQDINDAFTAQNATRWWDETAGSGRWLTYDRFAVQSGRAYMPNWAGTLGINTGTTEVLGKKDVSTQRMAYTTAWGKAHLKAVEKAFAGRIGSIVYRTQVTNASFTSAASITASLPSGYSVQYASSPTTTTPSSWVSDHTLVAPGNYLFMRIVLSRDYVSSATTQVLGASFTYATQSFTSAPVATTNNALARTGQSTYLSIVVMGIIMCIATGLIRNKKQHYIYGRR